MTRLPRITGAELARALLRAGFRVARIRGSHHVMEHEDGRITVVPVHAGVTLPLGLLQQILHDADLSRDELIDLL